MFSLRSTRQPAFLRSAVSSTNRFAVTGRRFASDYGSGEARPDLANPSADKEHPGPPPPNTKGKGSQGSEASKSSSSEGDKKSTSHPQPKILADNPPANGEEPEEVARHNREMEQRADRPQEKVANEDAEKDKVHKGFWSGQGGRDKDP